MSTPTAYPLITATSSTCLIQHQAAPALSTSINTVGGQVANILQLLQLFINTSGNSQALPTASTPSNFQQPVNPFILNFKTNLTCVCQSFHQNFSSSVQLVVAQAECCLVQKITTGTNFLGREFNSHYIMFKFLV